MSVLVNCILLVAVIWFQVRVIRRMMTNMWEILYMRNVLEGEDKSLARRIIQQFVAKVVIKEGRGTLYYIFPFPDDLYMPSYGNLDPRGFEPLTSTVRL